MLRLSAHRSSAGAGPDRRHAGVAAIVPRPRGEPWPCSADSAPAWTEPARPATGRPRRRPDRVRPAARTAEESRTAPPPAWTRPPSRAASARCRTSRTARCRSVDRDGRVVPGTGLRKFVDALPTPGPLRPQRPGLATCRWRCRTRSATRAATTTRSGCRSTPSGCTGTCRPPGCAATGSSTWAPTRRGHNTVAPPERPWHLGPMILARRGRPVRVKFINQLPTGRAGELFLPVDAHRRRGRHRSARTARRRTRRTGRCCTWPARRPAGSAPATRGSGSPRPGEITPYPTGAGPDPRAGHAAARRRRHHALLPERAERPADVVPRQHPRPVPADRLLRAARALPARRPGRGRSWSPTGCSRPTSSRW